VRIVEDNRPHLRAELEGQDVLLRITLPDGQYDVPHQILLEWVRDNKDALSSESWLKQGAYHWPPDKIPKDMMAFLSRFKS